MMAFDIAKNLGDTMSSSKEYIRFKEAETKYKNDLNAKELVKKFRKKQKMVDATAGNSDIVAQLRNELTELFIEVEKNETIKELNDALNDFLIFRQNIYEKIEAPISIDAEALAINEGQGSKKGCGGCNNGCGHSK